MLLKVLIWLVVVYVIGILVTALIKEHKAIKFVTSIDVGDIVYKVKNYKDNPITDTVVVRMRVLDIQDGWIKFSYIKNNEFMVENSPTFIADVRTLYEKGYKVENHSSEYVKHVELIPSLLDNKTKEENDFSTTKS